jgi:hypothetical protein
MTCTHPRLKTFTFSDGKTIQCCPDCSTFDKKRHEVLGQIAPTHHEYELWKYQPVVRKMVNKTLGRHRRHHREDLVAHCYAELAARFYQYKGAVRVWAWAKVVLKGVLAEWLDTLIKSEDVIVESNGTNPDLRTMPEKAWTGDKFEDEVPTIVRPEQPKGAAPDGDEDLTAWAQGDITFIQADEVKHSDEMTVDERAELESAKERVPEDEDDAPVEVPPTTTRIYCMECTEVRNVLQQFDREEIALVPAPKAGNYRCQNKFSTFVLECGHSREESKTLSRLWIRLSRATGKPRGRPAKINEAVTL